MLHTTENTPDLFGQFARVEWLLRRYHMHNHRMHGPMCDPHRGQGRILALLKLQPEISQKELAYLLDMRPQSLSELLAKLERGGYITRAHSQEDRRVMNIRLTGKGADAAGQRPRGDKLFHCLTTEEQVTLNTYLERIATMLEEQIHHFG